MGKRGKERGARTPQRERSFRAGCGRSVKVQTDQPDLAYTLLEYSECAPCAHRVEPEGALSFCTWRPEDAPHPFAQLALLQLE